MAATKLTAAVDKNPPRGPTPLSAVFRRLAKEEVVSAPVDLQFEGFGEERAAEPARPDRVAPGDTPPAPEPAARQPRRGRARDWPAEAPPVFDPVPEPAAAVSVLGADLPSHPPMPHNRRLYRRVPLPAEVEIAGVRCSLIDISIGGFAATGVPSLDPNAGVPVTLRLTIDGIEVGTQLVARFVELGRSRSSARFVEPSPSQTAFLRYLVTWRGASIGAVGTTTLLDAITGGAARDADNVAGFGRPRRRRWWPGRGKAR